MEKRTLSAAYKFYCDKTLENAHSAEADTLATFEILEAQVKQYEGMTMVDNLGKTLGKFENEMSTLHSLAHSNMIDLAGRMIVRNGIEVFNFGKYRGKPVLQVLEEDPNYYDWMMNGDFSLDTKRRLTRIKLRGFNANK